MSQKTSTATFFRLSYFFVYSLPLLLVLLPAGCGSLPSGQKWGENATLLPGSERIASSAYNAMVNPSTWAPLAGAALFSIDDFDEQLSDYAIEHNPLFGSVDDAADGSDKLRDSLIATVVLTSLATPSGDESGEWITNKAKGLLVDYAAMRSTSVVTSEIKSASKRERPNGSNDRSFPSGHSSSAFSAATLTSRNLDSLRLTDNQKTGIRIGLYTAASGTAWARIEAGMHYPSDVLAGAALGNFMSNFIHDAFLGLDQNSVDVQVDAYPDYKMISIRWAFY